MLDPHVEEIGRWLAAEPRLTALVILGRLAERLLKALRRKAAGQLIAGAAAIATATAPPSETALSSRSEAPPLFPLAPQTSSIGRAIAELLYFTIA